MRLRNFRSMFDESYPAGEAQTVSPRAVLHSLGMSDEAEGEEDQSSNATIARLPVDEVTGARNRLLNLPITADPLRLNEPAVIRRDLNNKFAAQLRRLVTRLSASQQPHHSAQFIVVSGVGARKGAELIASSLAVTCAANGFQVLLVDANLPSPSLHKIFGVSNNAGLSDLLSSTEPPNLFTRPTSIPNLAIISAGLRASNWASLLSRHRVIHRLEAIASAFDYVVIDASALPPTLLARVALNADQVALAVKRHHSSMRELERTIGILRGEAIENCSVMIIE